MIVQKLLSLITDKNKRKFFIYGLGQAFNLISPLIVAPYIISVCNEDGFGKAGLGFALALFLILIVDYAFDIKGTKEVAENRENIPQLQKILNTTIFTKIILFTLTVVIALSLICFVPFFNQEKTLFFFSILIVLAQVFNPVWFLQGLENFTLVSILNMCSKTTYVILVYSFVIYKNDYVLVNLFLGLSSLVFNALGLIIIKNKFHFEIIRPKWDEIRNILKTDFSFCVSQLFLSVRQLSPLVLTSYFLGYYVAGQYKIIEQIITLVRTFIQVYLKFFYPSVCYKISKELTNGFSFWKKYSLGGISFISLLLAVIFIFSEEVLGFFNASPETITHLNLIFRVSLAVSFLISVTLPLEQLMFVANQHKIYVRITIFVTAVNVCLMLFLIKPFNLYGVIVPLIISEFFFIALYYKNSYIFLNKKVKDCH